MKVFEYEASDFGAVQHTGYKGSLSQCGEIPCSGIFIVVMAFDYVQRFTQLQHGSKLVLAGIETVVVAPKITDFTIDINCTCSVNTLCLHGGRAYGGKREETLCMFDDEVKRIKHNGSLIPVWYQNGSWQRTSKTVSWI